MSLSYATDHRAWQQRVAQEQKAKNAIEAAETQYGKFMKHPDIIDYYSMRNNLTYQKEIKVKARQFGANYGLPTS